MIKIISPEELPTTELIFSGGEVQVKLQQLFTGYGAYIGANLYSSDDIMKLLMYTDAIRRTGVKRVDLVMPYVPYARQDRVCAPGEALSIKVFADLINAQKYDTVRIWDAHSDVTPALINNCTNVHCKEFVRKIPNIQNMILVAPDAGATKKIVETAKHCKTSFIQATKIRNVNTGEISGTEVHGTMHWMNRYLIVDDICDGGRTFIELAKELKKADSRVDLYVTHGIFSKGFAVFDELIDNIYCANPWPIFTESHNRHRISI